MTEQEEKKQKREYRLGNPLTPAEYRKRYVKKKSNENKEIRVYIPIELKNFLVEYCKKKGVSQSEQITNLVQDFKKMTETNS